MSLSKPFEENNLQNSSQYMRSSISLPVLPGGRSAPLLPPRPSNSIIGNTGYNSYLPHSGPSYGGYNSYSSYMPTPYRSSPYSSYGNYGSYGSSYDGYNSFGGYPNHTPDDHERRFIQYAEESSRNTFASVESIVRAFNSISMMLDNTFFAMTSSFRAVLSVAENFGRLRTMFGHIWYSINIFRFFTWLYRKFLRILGYNVPRSTVSMAWTQAKDGGAATGGAPGTPGGAGSSWPTIAFLGVLVSAPYIISKFLPKYEDKGDPANWKTPGIRAKAVFDFIATAPNELTIQMNDLVLLAPTYIQDEMSLKNSGWAFAVCKGKSGVVPLNYLVISKNRPIIHTNKTEDPPIPRVFPKTHQKRVSFGENQIFENVDLEDYMVKKETEPNPTNQDNKNPESTETQDKQKEEKEKT